MEKINQNNRNQERRSLTLLDKLTILTIATSLVALSAGWFSRKRPGRFAVIRTLITQRVELWRARLRLRKSSISTPNPDQCCMHSPACGSSFVIAQRRNNNMTVRIIQEVDANEDGTTDLMFVDKNGGDIFISLRWLLIGAGALVGSAAGYLLLV